MGPSASTPPLVYLGPSLGLRRARQLLPDAEYRAPVKRGDLPAAYEGTVVIIDGEFHQSLSVSPKEVLRLLDQGTRVVGASSMGALRAAELWPMGMEGCGWVFEGYRSGRIIADDEVAITYSPEELTCLTVPLVNVRKWVDDLEAAGLVNGFTARRLLGTARRIYYADRALRNLLQTWESVLTATDIEQLLSATGGRITDVKAADAELALASVQRSAQTPRAKETNSA